MTHAAGRGGARGRRRGASAACVLALAGACASPSAAPTAVATFEPDDDAPIAPIPLDLSVDAAAAALGARLFVDRSVSHDGAVACVDCHDLESGGDHDGAHTALEGRDEGPINVPSIFNLRFQFRWSWAGRWTNMADQIDAAMRAPHAMATETDDAVPRLEAAYGEEFRRVFPADGLTPDTFRAALTEYLFSLTTPQSPFDRFLRGDESALDADARAGWDAFQSNGCVSCHQGVNVGGNLFQRFGVMEDYFAGRTSVTRADLGRFAVTDDEADRHVFRVPSLRNVALTAPYFHDGSTATLEEAVQVMARYQLGRVLAPDDTRRIVAFLRSLTAERGAGAAP